MGVCIAIIRFWYPFRQRLSLLQNRIGIRFVKLRSMMGLNSDWIGFICPQNNEYSDRLSACADGCPSQILNGLNPKFFIQLIIIN